MDLVRITEEEEQKHQSNVSLKKQCPGEVHRLY